MICFSVQCSWWCGAHAYIVYSTRYLKVQICDSFILSYILSIQCYWLWFDEEQYFLKMFRFYLKGAVWIWPWRIKFQWKINGFWLCSIISFIITSVFTWASCWPSLIRSRSWHHSLHVWRATASLMICLFQDSWAKTCRLCLPVHFLI